MSRGLNQAALAELCGVQQASVSKWESGKHVPDRATRGRLRAILHAYDSKSDQAILRSVRYAHTCSGLSMIDPPHVIEASLGACRAQGADRADLIKIPKMDWYMHYSPTPEAGLANEKALRSGDVLAIHVTMEVTIFRAGERMPVRTTYTPLWLSDGTFVLRGDSTILPIGEYHGQMISVITPDDVPSEV